MLKYFLGHLIFRSVGHRDGDLECAHTGLGIRLELTVGYVSAAVAFIIHFQVIHALKVCTLGLCARVRELRLFVLGGSAQGLRQAEAAAGRHVL